MKPRMQLPVACCLLSLLSGCAALQNLNIERPTYAIREVDPRVDIAIPFSASTIDLDFQIEVQNSNDVELRLDSIDFDLLVNGSHILQGQSHQRIQIPANGTGDVRLRTSLGYDNLRSLFREVADTIQGRRARYELQGKAHYDTPIGRMSFPFTVYSMGGR